MTKETLDITESVDVFGFASARELISQTLDNQNFTENYSAYSKPNIPSGFKNIDLITKGFKKGELITISTRPGSGKTAFMLSLAYNMSVLLQRNVAIFSPERSSLKVISRLIESETSHSLDKIKKGNLKEGNNAHAISTIQRIASANLFIDDSKGLSPKEVLLRCHQVLQKHHAEIILADNIAQYTEHIHDPAIKKSVLEELTLTLKHVAKDLNIPVICFTQVKPLQGQINGNTAPSAKELPGFIVDNSDTIMMLNRKPFHKINKDKIPKGNVEIIIEKQNSEDTLEKTYIRFIESIDRFVNE